MSPKPTYEELEQRVEVLEEEIALLKHNQAAFKARESFLDRIIDQSPFATWISDAEGTLQRANPALKSFLNLSDEQLVGKYNVLQDPVVERQGLMPLIRSVFEEGRTINFTCDWDGNDIPTLDLRGSNSVSIEATMFPIFDSEGILTHVVLNWIDITARKEAEDALRDSEAHLRTVIETIPELVWLKDPEGVYITCNRRFERFFGAREEDIKGGTDYDFVDKQLADFFREKDMAAMAAGRPLVNEEEITYRDDGHKELLETIKTPMFDSQGTLIGVLGVARDITERKQTEEVLRLERKRLALLLESFPGFIYLQARDYTLRYANHFFKERFGDPAGRFCHEILWSRGEPCEKCPTFEVFATKKPMTWEWSQAPDNRIYTVYDFPFVDSDGSELVLEIGLDITEQKKAEENLKESESLYRLTLSNVNDTVVLTDDRGNFTFCCPNVQFITGFSDTELMDLGNIEVLIGDNLFDGRELVDKGSLHNIETSIISKNGNVHHVLIGVKCIDFKNSSRLYTLHDITETKELQKRLHHAQRLEAIGNLAGGIAHDFNNLLCPIIGMAELLLDDLPQGSLEHENALEIFYAGKRACELVNQILAFSRQSEHQLVPIRMQQILKEVLKLTRSTIPSNIAIKHAIQADCGVVMADATQLHQIAMNLITNAYHAVTETGGDISVELREIVLDKDGLGDGLLPPGNYLKLSVSDNGTGIPAHIMDKIFDPYFTTKQNGKGTGLGLAVVYGIVKEYRGDIKVYSEEGRGTTFNVYLPVIKRTTENPLSEKFFELETGTERILLVDDEEMVAKLEKKMLERLGYQVTEFTSSVDALKAFTASPESFDLVISDIAMPNMTGDQLSQNLLSIRADIPIILCTGFSERLHREQTEDIGVKGFLMKPILKKEMAHLVRKVLDEAGHGTPA